MAIYIKVYVPASNICTNRTIYLVTFCNFAVSASDVHPNCTANQMVMFVTVPLQSLTIRSLHLRLCTLSTASFLAYLWISLPAESISLTYILYGLKSTFNTYLLSLRSFYTAFLSFLFFLLQALQRLFSLAWSKT